MATALAGAGVRRDLRHQHGVCGHPVGDEPAGDAEAGLRAAMAAGVVAISGTLAMLIPPVALVIYRPARRGQHRRAADRRRHPGHAGHADHHGRRSGCWSGRIRRAPAGARGPAGGKSSRLLKVVGPMLLLFGLVTGVHLHGVATPTEASALGAFGALVLAICAAAAQPARPAARALSSAAHGHLHDRR